MKKLIIALLILGFVSWGHAAWDGATNFPGALDTSATLYDVEDAGTVEDEHHDALAQAMIAVETKIGTGASTPVVNKALIGTGTGTSAWGIVTDFALGVDADAGDFDIHSIDGLYGVDDLIYIDMGNDGYLDLEADVAIRPGAPIVFTSLDTATRAIDLLNSGLAGATDYWIYASATNYWNAVGDIHCTDVFTTTLSDTAGGTYMELSTTAFEIVAPEIVRIHGAQNDTLIYGQAAQPVGAWVDDGVSNGTTTITDVGGAAHGLSFAAGDLAHITLGTGSVEGLYRVVSDDGTNVVVDRAISAATNLDIRFYQNVIAFGTTDGTNGQRIMNYSHQDKPLQIGGDVLVASTNLGSEDVLIGNLIGLPNATTEPGGAFTGGTILYSKDSSDGATNATLGIYTEQAVEADAGGITASHKLQIWINGVEYYIELDAV